MSTPEHQEILEESTELGAAPADELPAAATPVEGSEPAAAAEQILPISHVVVSIKPIDADASAPRLPTIDASIYCIIVVVSCAKMAGVAKLSTRRACWPRVIGLLLRIMHSSWSFCLFIFINYISSAKLQKKGEMCNHGTVLSVIGIIKTEINVLSLLV